MKLRVLIALLALFGTMGLAQVSDTYNPSEVSVNGPVSPQAWFPGQRGGPLFDNGPLITNPGAGSGGADISELQNTTLGDTTLGGGVNGFRIADDFTIPAGESWAIEAFTFFAYQSFAPSAGTITGVTFRIWDGPPLAAGSNVVFGDTTTNRLTTTGFANLFRVVEGAFTNTDRAIQANVCEVDLNLDAGTYWVDIGVSGSASFSGPWMPPVTIPGQGNTGNGMQSDNAGMNFAPWLDGGSNNPKGMPFIIDGGQACSITSIALNGNSAVLIDGDCTSGVDLYCQGPNGLTLVQSGVVVDGPTVVEVGFNPDSFYFVAAPGDTAPINGLTTAITVPTLQTWALIGFVALLSIAGLAFMRRNRLANQA